MVMQAPSIFAPSATIVIPPADDRPGNYHPRQSTITREISRCTDKLLQRSGHHHWSAFNRILDIWNATHARDDARYMQSIAGLDRETLQLLIETYALLQYEAYNTPQDTLGPAYEELGTQNRHVGQYFTPWPICYMMAETQLGNVDWHQYSPERPCTILEPACGAGAMVLAAAVHIPTMAILCGCVKFTLVDLDETCCKMAELNMRLHGLARCAHVIHGNALERYFNQPDDEEDVAPIAHAVAPASETIPTLTLPTGQLAMFGGAFAPPAKRTRNVQA